MKKASIILMTLFLFMVVNPPTPAFAAGNFQYWTQIYSETNSAGTTKVFEANFPVGKRIKTSFLSSSGETIVMLGQEGASELYLPSGVVLCQALADGGFTFLVSLNSGDTYNFTVDSNGAPLTSDDEDELIDASYALSPGSSNVVSAAYDFNIEEGYDPINPPPRGALGCAASTVGLIGSYVGIAVSMPTGPGGWIFAIVMHEAAVIGFVTSCF